MPTTMSRGMGEYRWHQRSEDESNQITMSVSINAILILAIDRLTVAANAQTSE
jgi:hypothetical protein